MAALTKKQIVLVDNFNDAVKQLVSFAQERSTKLQAMSAKKKVVRLAEEAPLCALETIGPYLIKYADHIKEQNDKFFLENSFSDETGDDNILSLIVEVQSIYKQSQAAERAHINDTVDDMLIAYCAFVHSKK